MIMLFYPNAGDASETTPGDVPVGDANGRRRESEGARHAA